MKELIEKIGLDLKLLIAQVVNFLLVLLILWMTVYKPLVAMLNRRRVKIEKGMKDAEDAAKGLAEVTAVRKEKLAEAEKETLEIISQSAVQAKEKEEEILAAAKEKESDILKNATKLAAAKEGELEKKFFDESIGLVRLALEKTARLQPKEIDESLIEEAVQAVRKTRL